MRYDVYEKEEVVMCKVMTDRLQTALKTILWRPRLTGDSRRRKRYVCTILLDRNEMLKNEEGA